eukprot:tig00021434_g21326.t1
MRSKDAADGLVLGTLAVAAKSPLVGRSARQLRMRETFRAALLALQQRPGETLTVAVPDAPLIAGDVLLVACPPSVLRAQQHLADFASAVEIEDSGRFVNRPSPLKMALATILTVGMIVMPSIVDAVPALWYSPWNAKAAPNKLSLTHTVLLAGERGCC